jgi:tRNA(His) 5'-end guanylyltransferase
MERKTVNDIIEDLKKLSSEFLKVEEKGYLHGVEDPEDSIDQLNQKIDKFEDMYITKSKMFSQNQEFEFINPLNEKGQYYGIGSLSYPSDETPISYCIDVFNDVDEEIKLQIKNFSEFIENEEKKLLTNEKKEDSSVLNFDKELKDIKLDDRIKIYEKRSEYVIPSNEHIIVRIDGHKFSKFTKGLKRPFDYIFRKAMELTTIDLVKEYGAYTGYTQSDEITLVLPSLEDNSIEMIDGKTGVKSTDKRIRKGWTHLFKGRSQKISSLIAAFTSGVFKQHFRDLIDEERDRLEKQMEMSDTDIKYLDLLDRKVKQVIIFDARAFGVPSDEEVLNSFLFRTRDAEKNSKAGFAQTYCSHKELQNKNSKEQIEFTLSEKGKDWDLIEDKYKYGIFVKKELYKKVITKEESQRNKKTKFMVNKLNENGEIVVNRSRFVSYSEKLYYSDENVKKIMNKYL